MTTAKKTKILVADDDTFFLEVFTDMIENLNHECQTASNGLEALEKAESYRPDIIILDVIMPKMDGFETVKRLRDNPLTMHIPVVMATSLSDRASKLKALELGADELLSKPLDETELNIRIKNLLKMKKYRDYLHSHGQMLEADLVEKSEQLSATFTNIRRAYIETTNRLTIAAEHRDTDTGSHIKRISLYAQVLARQLGFNESEVEDIFFASPMHDIGKIGIPDNILLKPGKLTAEEFETMKSHSTIGYEILHNSDSTILNMAEEIAHTHHERWDGKGYPRGLKGEEIPIAGRIVQIVDIYDAVRSSRPYRAKGLDHETAMKLINENNNHGAFDPKVFEAFTKNEEKIKELFELNS
ncbi:MAG: response regulator [Deltaproteobacteria bacterium]|nr:response regulator [Deltaproteobacteria bacterium]